MHNQTAFKCSAPAHANYVPRQQKSSNPFKKCQHPIPVKTTWQRAPAHRARRWRRLAGSGSSCLDWCREVMAQGEAAAPAQLLLNGFLDLDQELDCLLLKVVHVAVQLVGIHPCRVKNKLIRILARSNVKRRRENLEWAGVTGGD